MVNKQTFYIYKNMLLVFSLRATCHNSQFTKICFNMHNLNYYTPSIKPFIKTILLPVLLGLRLIVCNNNEWLSYK